jgi:hypothetical protein
MYAKTTVPGFMGVDAAQTGRTTRHTLSSQPDCHQRGVPGSPSHRQEDEHDAQARNRGDGGPGADPGSM